MTEDTLVQRMKLNDDGAFDEIFQKYKDEAFRTAYLLSGSYSDSEDIVQETFINCYLNISSLREEDRFRAWFYRILVRNAYRVCKKRKREQPVEDIYEKADSSSLDRIEDRLLQSEMQKELLEHIRSLDAKQKTVVVLHYFDGLGISEISRITGCLEGTVKSRLYTARKNLKKSMEKLDSEWKEAVI